MKRIASLVALTGLVVVPAVSDAAPAPKRVERTVTLSYQGPCDAGIAGLHGGPATCPTAAQLAELVKKGEAYISFKAVDATGQKIGLRFYNTADFPGTVTSYCGGSAKALKVKAGQEMAVKTSVDPTCGGVPTTGTLTMVLSNLP